MSNSSPSITWRQLAVIISLLAFFGAGSGVLATKVDKKELIRVENRVDRKILVIQQNLKEDIQDLKKVQDKMDIKQDKIYDILIRQNN